MDWFNVSTIYNINDNPSWINVKPLSLSSSVSLAWKRFAVIQFSTALAVKQETLPQQYFSSKVLRFIFSRNKQQQCADHSSMEHIETAARPWDLEHRYEQLARVTLTIQGRAICCQKEENYWQVCRNELLSSSVQKLSSNITKQCKWARHVRFFAHSL